MRGAESHDTASIGGLVALPPVIFAALRETNQAQWIARRGGHLRLTHRSAKLERYCAGAGPTPAAFIV